MKARLKRTGDTEVQHAKGFTVVGANITVRGKMEQGKVRKKRKDAREASAMHAIQFAICRRHLFQAHWDLSGCIMPSVTNRPHVPSPNPHYLKLHASI